MAEIGLLANAFSAVSQGTKALMNQSGSRVSGAKALPSSLAQPETQLEQHSNQNE